MKIIEQFQYLRVNTDKKQNKLLKFKIEIK
jgi:hypothetical protein